MLCEDAWLFGGSLFCGVGVGGVLCACAVLTGWKLCFDALLFEFEAVDLAHDL